MINTDRLAEEHWRTFDPQFYDDTQDMVNTYIKEKVNDLQLALCIKIEQVIEETMAEATDEVRDMFMEEKEYEYVAKDLYAKFEEYK